MNSRKLFITGLLSIAMAILFNGCAFNGNASANLDIGDGANHPMLGVLDQFDHAPAKGPQEADMPVRALPTNSVTTDWPGNGLAQHPFLYYGEGNNVLYVVNHGRVVWTYAFPHGGEIDDAWMLSNGHIICTKMTDCYEVTPQKEIVWSYHCATNTQIHALQPIGLDKVMVVENGLPPHFYIINKATGEKIVSHELPTFTNTVKSIHTQFRNCRVTAQGTYLLPSLDAGIVNEYDKDWNLIWSKPVGRAWSAVRLKNGDTLIPGDQRGYVHEINPQGEIVWAIETNTLPDIKFRDVQTADRLANGDTLICNRGGSAKNSNPPQVVEVTPDKQVVWVLQDYKDLPSCTGIQLLDEPGIPENPGDLQH
jgi:outer membrane protein assembly factor BamB